MQTLGLFNKTFSFNFRGVNLQPTYWEAGAIVLLLFLLVLTLARVRYLYIHWSLSKPAVAMAFWGFLLTLILEGFLLISGNTLLTEIFGWKNAPKPISTALDAGRSKLVKVLGAQDQIPSSYAQDEPTYQSVEADYLRLGDSDRKKLRSIICAP